MKHLLTILCVLTSFTALAQFPNTHTQSNPYTKEVFNGSVNPKKGLINGRYADTAAANLDYVAQEPGAQIIVGNTLYIRDITKTKWVTVGEYGLTASNITILNDSSISICNINNCDTFKFTNIIVNNFSVLNDSTIIVCDGNNTCDTLHIAPTQFAKSYVDSIKINGSLIYYYINGNAVLAGVIGGKDGLISGGIVTWSGQGLKFYVSPATYVISNIYYHSGLDSVTLATAPTSDSRIDIIGVDTTGHAFAKTGIPSTTPIVPQADVSSQIALTTGILLNANDTVPSNVITNTIYSEHTIPPEWTTGIQGAAMTIDWENTIHPYAGTKDIYVSKYSNNSTPYFISPSLYSVTNDATLSFWIYLNGKFTNQMYVELFDASTSASSWLRLTPYFNVNDSGKYQLVTVPLSKFIWTNYSGNFDRVLFNLTGYDTSGTKGFYVDNISLQKGINSIPPQTDYSNKLDSVLLSNDSLFQYVKGVKTFKGLASGSGIGNTKYILQGYGAKIDSSGNNYTVAVDTTLLKDSLYVGKGITNDTISYPGHNLIKIDSQYVRDTSLNLAGGTTGQVLKKNSSTNGDWSWQDESGGTTIDTTSLSNRIDAKQDAITLTTTGTSGAATLSGSTLNIPQYSGGGGSSIDSITPNLFAGLGYSDTKKIQLALDLARSKNQKLIIANNYERNSSLWMIDSAILLNSNEHIIIRNATLKLSDSARDNIFRTANCGLGITNPGANPVTGITIEGIGNAVIQGADNPRSSGDKGKTLTLTPNFTFTNSYGTDAGKAGRSQKGDWRNYGIIIAYGSNINVSGLKLSNIAAYGISFSRCNTVHVHDIVLDMPGYAAGHTERLLYNQGGLDFNQSINGITVENISGISADDNMAFNIVNDTTAHAGDTTALYPTGDTTSIGFDSSKNVTVNNVNARSAANNIRVIVPSNFTAKNFSLTNISNNISPNDYAYGIWAAVQSATNVIIGQSTGTYAAVNPFGTISNFYINNLKSDYIRYGVLVNTTLSESFVNNVVKTSAANSSFLGLHPVSNPVYLRNVAYIGTTAGKTDVTGFRNFRDTAQFSGYVKVGNSAGTGTVSPIAVIGNDVNGESGLNISNNTNGTSSIASLRIVGNNYLNTLFGEISPANTSALAAFKKASLIEPSDAFKQGHWLVISIPDQTSGIKYYLGGRNDSNNVSTLFPSGNLGFNTDGTVADVPSAIFHLTSKTKAFLPPRMTTTQRNTLSGGTGFGGVAAAGTRVGGSGYTNGTYSFTPLTTVSGVGSGATANITVSGGAVTAIIINLARGAQGSGSGYKVGDTLTASGLGAGTGFYFLVGSVSTAVAGDYVYNTTTGTGNTFNGTNWQGDFATSSASTLTLKHGVDYVFTGTTSTWTLPAVSSTLLGRQNAIWIKNRGTGSITLNSDTGSTLYTTSAQSTITIASGAAVELLPDGTYFNVMFNN